MQNPDPDHTAIVCIDVQTRLASAMPAECLASLFRSCRILLEAARQLELQVLYTEQYPQGLGETASELRADLQSARALRVEKTCFSACGAAPITEALTAGSVRRVVVVGMESHVCVYQTVRDLAALSIDVQVPFDGVCSRRADHKAQGLELCARVGATVTTTETLVFDWLRDSKHEAFKPLSRLIR